MPSEVKRGSVRILANYTRVFATVALGLVLVRLLLAGMGNEGWALIALLGSTLGMAAMIQDIVRASMIRELGAAHHSGQPTTFRSTYNAAVAISAVTAMLAAGTFTALWFIVPWFKISPDLIPAAQWLVAARGAQVFVVILLTAPFNMYKVTERMVAHNAWLVADRLCYVLAAVWILFTQGTDDPARSIVLWGFISAALVMVTQLLAVAGIIFVLPGLIPAPSTISWKAIKSLLRIGGWNAAATSATLLHFRVAEIIMNLALGLGGNLILALALRLADAVRRLAVGMTEGLDAVSTRLSTAGSAEAIRTLMHHSTRLHGVATFPTAVIMLVLTEAVLRTWVGGSLQDPQTTVPMTVTLIRIMTLGFAAQAISDGWIRILYGAGHVARYAPLILVGAVINPLLAGLLLLVLPDSLRYTAVVWSYCSVLVIIHGGVLPMIGARALRITYVQMVAPLLRPLLIALACSPILLLASRLIEQWTWLTLVVSVGLYGTVYLLLCVIFVMDRPERVRFTKAALRRLPWVTRNRPGPGP